MAHVVEFHAKAPRWMRCRTDDDRVTDPPFELDASGFLPEPEGHDPRWMRPADAALAGGWVLLGEPGSGKTREFSEYVPESERQVDVEPGHGGCIWVDGADLYDEPVVDELLGRHLRVLPAVRPLGPLPAPLHLVIDQLDESPFAERLPRWLRRVLTQRDTRTLRIWIACRTSHYSTLITRVLAQVLPSCVVGDLAPLTREQAADLVADVGVEAAPFLAAVADKRVGAFAAIPLTLKVLLGIYQDNVDHLPAGPADLFDLGVTRLASDPEPGIDPGKPPAWPGSTVQQRVAIAARIAARLVLSGRRSVHTTMADHMSDTALPLGEMVGDSENAGAGPFEVTKLMVEETLQTALFTRTSRHVVAFVHSSFLAYLAASYLTSRMAAPIPSPMPRRQLEGLFLVSAPDEPTAAIPEPLRETAAWLVSKAPQQARWLVEADPEGLAGYTTILTDPAARAALVDGLLDNAERLELADHAWERGRWRLEHPGLAAQLATELDNATNNPTMEWSPAYARARLAVRMTHESGLAQLAGPLLDLADNDLWTPMLRQSAVKAAMTVAPQTDTIARLKALLARLPRTTASTLTSGDDDGDDGLSELVGTLLDLLWPDHLTFSEAAVYVGPTSNPLFLGMYYIAVHRFAYLVAENDVPALLSWLEAMLRRYGVQFIDPEPTAADDWADTGTTAPTPIPTPAAIAYERLGDLRNLVGSVTDRVLTSSHCDDLLDRLASVVLWFLTSSDHLPLPVSLDVVTDSDGVEPSATRDLRRSFGEALARAIVDLDPRYRPYHLHHLIAPRWASAAFTELDVPAGLRRARRTTLLDQGDADWAAQRSAQTRDTGNTDLADLLGTLSDWLRPRAPVVSDDSPQPQRAYANDFATEQRTRLDQAEAGDPTAFWVLVKYLAVDPTTGAGQPIRSWHYTDYAGTVLWPAEELAQRFQVAALQYLVKATDHHEEWLGLSDDWRARAGIVALAALYRGEDHTDASSPHTPFAHVPSQCWAQWAGAIVEAAGQFGGVHEEFDDALIAHAADHASDELHTAVDQYVRTRIATGNTLHLPNLPRTVASPLVDVAGELVAALGATPAVTPAPATSRQPAVVADVPMTLPPTPDARAAALDTLGLLLRISIGAGVAAAVTMAHEVLSEPPVDADPEVRDAMAGIAGYALLAADAATHWAAVYRATHDQPARARETAFRCARAENIALAVSADLDDSALAQLWRWLTTLNPGSVDVIKSGFHMVTVEDSIQDWRRDIVAALAERATPGAVRALAGLVREYPDQLTIQAALHRARRTLQARTSSYLTSAEVNALLADPERRAVFSAAQLAEVIVDVLGQIAEDLPSHSNLLWDCERGELPSGSAKNAQRPLFWRPKPEGALGAYLHHELTLRLHQRRIVVNREVVIRPTSAGDSGERPDLKVDAFNPATAAAQAMTVPIEIKGAFHDDVLTSQWSQLAQGYLVDLNTTDGIYLVGWFPLEHWTAPDGGRRSRVVTLGSAEQVAQRLEEQAIEIGKEGGWRTRPVMMIVPRAVRRDS